jgi:farnesyl-diphosphate farnesyltransferase
MLEETSRTFYIPISRLPPRLQEAVGAAYLCLRAIDEIEDHPALTVGLKSRLLRNISRTIQSSVGRVRVEDLLVASPEFASQLAPVTSRISDWMALAPASIAHRIWDGIATMADRMAGWAEEAFCIQTEADLDRYTMGVAGAVGLMLSDLWAWFDGTQSDRGLAIGFGRGLQAVNILRNRQEDLNRGVDFFPDGWDQARMLVYARRNLALADSYLRELPAGPARDFCRIPLALANATLEALEAGRPKLERQDVVALLSMLDGSGA